MARKLGTGKVADDTGARKWAGGVRDQVASAAAQKGINARYIPLTQITLDPNNPRQLDVSPDKVAEINRLVPIQPEWLDADDDKDWWDDFAAAIGEHLDDKAFTDYLDLVLLALSIKSHERLLNPVTTYANDSGSELSLIAGERRYLAHLILGESVIAARILPHRPDELEKDILQWEENNQRLELSLYEQLINLKRLLDGWEKQRNAKLSVSQMVALAGLPRVTAHRYLTVIRCTNPALMAAVKSGQITSLRKAADLAALSKAELAEALNPTKAAPKKQPIFKIKRAKDYSPVQSILKAAAESLATKKLAKEIDGLDLDTAEGIAEGFDLLAQYVAEKQGSDQ